MKEARRRGTDQLDDQTGWCGAYRALVERPALHGRERGSCFTEGRNAKGERRRVSLSKTGKKNEFGQLEEWKYLGFPHMER